MLVPKKKPTLITATPAKEIAKTEETTKRKKLPPDEYKDEIPSKKIEVDDTRHIIVSVKRGGEDGLPCLDVRWYQTTDVYTGFTKRGINIPVEYLPELLQVLNDSLEECEAKGLIE